MRILPTSSALFFPAAVDRAHSCHTRRPYIPRSTYAEHLQRTPERSPFRVDTPAEPVSFARHLFQINDQERLTASYHTSGARTLPPPRQPVAHSPAHPAAPSLSATLPTLATITPPPRLAEFQRVQVTYQLTIPTARGQILDLIA